MKVAGSRSETLTVLIKMLIIGELDILNIKIVFPCRTTWTWES